MQAIADALKTRLLAGFPNLRVDAFIPDTLEPPAAFVGFPTITYDVDLSEDFMAVFDVHVIVSRSHDRSAYKALSPYLLPSGVRAAILGDRTLGGIVQSCRVPSASVSPISIGNIDYIEAVFQVEIYDAA